MITAAEHNSMIKYTSIYLDMLGWNLSDWNVRLLFNTFIENNAHSDGILHHKVWTQTAKMKLIY